MKNKKRYSIPSKVNEPDINSKICRLTILNKKKDDAREIELPKWLWDCIKRECNDEYERGRSAIIRELKNTLQIN